MRARLLTLTVFVSLLAVLLTSATGYTQSIPLNLQVNPQNVKRYSISTLPSSSFSGTAQCPAVGVPAFFYDFTINIEPINDAITYIDGKNRAVMEIAHLRVTSTSTYAATGNQFIQRQDWTRIKENPNGIDDTTGIRHYIGLFSEETQQPTAKKAVVTGTTEGVMTLREPLSFLTGPLANTAASRVDVIQFLSPQPAWLEPFQVNDARSCAFLNDGKIRPVDSFYNNNCVVNGNQVINYNGVQFTGNIVGCAQTTGP
jgi:hypothetical protein